MAGSTGLTHAADCVDGIKSRLRLPIIRPSLVQLAALGLFIGVCAAQQLPPAPWTDAGSAAWGQRSNRGDYADAAEKRSRAGTGSHADGQGQGPIGPAQYRDRSTGRATGANPAHRRRAAIPARRRTAAARRSTGTAAPARRRHTAGRDPNRRSRGPAVACRTAGIPGDPAIGAPCRRASCGREHVVADRGAVARSSGQGQQRRTAHHQ